MPTLTDSIQRVEPSTDPVVAAPQPGEALASLVYRHAHANRYTVGQLATYLGLQHYFKTRTTTSSEAARAGTFFNLSPHQIHQATIASLPPSVVGTHHHRTPLKDPFGWATQRWSNRCLDCHDEDGPWLVLHQTALLWACPRHNRYLTSHHRTMFTGRWHLNLHRVAAPSNNTVTAADLDAQQHLVTLLANQQFEQLRTVRAATALASIAHATDGGPPAPPETAHNDRDPHLNAPKDQPRTQNGAHADETRRRDVHYSLQRPHPDPATAGAHVRQALQHLNSDGKVDPEWARTVWNEANCSRGLRAALAPYLVQLELAPSVEIARRPAPFKSKTERREPADEWVNLCRQFYDALTSAGWTRDHLPGSLLTNEEPFASPVLMPLARAVLLRQVLYEENTSRAVNECGASRPYVTLVRSRLCRPPSPTDASDLREALKRLLAQPQTDNASLRLRQGRVNRVNSMVLRQLNLHRVTDPSTSASSVAAIWLWTTVTDTHHLLAPFVDGNRVKSSIRELQSWQRKAPPESLAALLDWNRIHNHEDATAVVPNSTTTAVTARSNGSATTTQRA